MRPCAKTDRKWGYAVRRGLCRSAGVLILAGETGDHPSQEFPMVAIAAADVAPATMGATVTPLPDPGEMPRVYPGGRGPPVFRPPPPSDPRRVRLHTGRLEPARLKLDREGFRFVRHD